MLTIVTENRLKLLQEGKIKPKAPAINKGPFRGNYPREK